MTLKAYYEVPGQTLGDHPSASMKLPTDKFLSTEKNTVEFLLCLVAAEFCVYAFHVS